MKQAIDIIISDTIGDHLTSAYRALLPNVEMRGYSHPDEPAQLNRMPNPHGAWCGWLAGLPLQVVSSWGGPQFRLHFVAAFNPNGDAYADDHAFLLEMIEQIRPSYVLRSWGAPDGDDELIEVFNRLNSQQFISDFLSLKKSLGFVDVAAAGNSDRNDADNDINFPQRGMPDETIIVGSIRRDGVPVESSSDGEGLNCVMWGDRILSPALDGLWDAWSGTSAACPKFGGVLAAKGLDHQGAIDLIDAEASKPKGITEWHPKFGEGSCEHLWQQYAQQVPARLWPKPNDIRS